MIIKIMCIFHLPGNGESLVDRELTLWVFLQGGVIIALGAWGAYVLALVYYNVPFDNLYQSALTYYMEDSPPLQLTTGRFADAQEQLDILGGVQGSVFQAILIGQWFNLFLQKHRFRQPWGRDMLVNKLTYIGLFTAILTLAVVCYIPPLNSAVFDTQFPPAISLASPFAAGILLVIYEICRRSLLKRGYCGGLPNEAVLRGGYKKIDLSPPADHVPTTIH